MIDIRTENGHATMALHCKGINEVLSDVAVIIKTVYEAILETNKEAAEDYKKRLEILTKDGLMFDEERLKAETEALEKEKKENEDLLKSLAKAIADILEKAEDEKDE